MTAAQAFAGSQEGALVLADISGYTAFVAQTEIDHSWEILHELLDTMVRSAEGRLEVSQVEGDCILFISGLDDAEVLAALEEVFISYHRRLRDMQTVTTCPCQACANIGMLKLKFVFHRGTFSRQRLGAVEQLHGADVIVAHRLLKNRVPLKEYILLTDVVLQQLPTERQSRFVPYSEDYDLGAVGGGYEAIAHLWEAAEAAERKRVVPEEAIIDDEVVAPLAPAEVGRRMLEPEVMKRYLMAESVEGFAGARGTELGSEYHCHHGPGMSSQLRVVSLDPGHEVTIVSTSPVGDVYITTRLEPSADGGTRIRRLWWAELPTDAAVAAGMIEALKGFAAPGRDALEATFTQIASA